METEIYQDEIREIILNKEDINLFLE